MMMNGMYGASPYSKTITTSQEGLVELPAQRQPVMMTPSSSSAYTGPCGSSRRCYGIVLALLAAASAALGVADVVYTYQTYMNGRNCAQNANSLPICNPNVLIFTWIAVGIWASLPVFYLGIQLVCHSGQPQHRSGCRDLFVFLCAFVFTTAMVVISALEVYKGVGVFYWNYSAPLTSNDLTKAIIPIAIAALGFLEHVMCVLLLWHDCCGCFGGASSMGAGGMMAGGCCGGQDCCMMGQCCGGPECGNQGDCCCCMGAPMMSSGPTMMQKTTTYTEQPAPITTTYERPCNTGCPPPMPAPQPSCAPCQQQRAVMPTTSFYSSGPSMGGGASNCMSCAPSPATFNYFRQSNVGPNPAYSFYR